MTSAKMEKYTIPGTLGPVTIFHYPSRTSSKKGVLIMKGIYREHDPGGMSWDNTLVSLLQPDHHVVFVRTSRLEGKEDREAFVGKTFPQECLELEHAFQYCDRQVFPTDSTWEYVGVSFGGTTLLGTPSVLLEMETLVMIGSGCGRSIESTRPLLSTLPETETLLASLDSYHRAFFFIHGGKDTVVPLASQKLIFARAAQHASTSEWIELPGLDHGLQDDTEKSHLAEQVTKYLRV